MALISAKQNNPVLLASERGQRKRISANRQKHIHGNKHKESYSGDTVKWQRDSDGILYEQKEKWTGPLKNNNNELMTVGEELDLQTCCDLKSLSLSLSLSLARL